MATMACWTCGQAARDTCPSPLGMPVSGPLPSMKPNRAVFQEGNAAAAISKEHTWATNCWVKRKKSKRRQEKIHKQQPEPDRSTYMPEKRLDIAKRRGENGGCSSGQSGSSLVTGSYAERKIGVQDSRSRELQIGRTWCRLSLLGCCWA